MTTDRWRWMKVTLAALAALTFGMVAGCGGDEEDAGDGGDAGDADTDAGTRAPVFPNVEHA